jgi:hypothetical protein
MKMPLAPLALIFVASLSAACTVTTRPLLKNPQTTVEVMRRSYREDDSGLFLHTLGRPVLREYSEHVLRVGWSEIRPKVGEFIERAKVVSTKDYDAPKPDPLAPPEFVWPEINAKLKAVRLRLDGEEENFLFEREVDEAPENTKQAKGFWIGDRYFVKTEHPSPGTYLEGNSPESERTHWRLVFPYYPFQKNGPLTARLQDTIAGEKNSG